MAYITHTDMLQQCHGHRRYHRLLHLSEDILML